MAQVLTHQESVISASVPAEKMLFLISQNSYLLLHHHPCLHCLLYKQKNLFDMLSLKPCSSVPKVASLSKFHPITLIH